MSFWGKDRFYSGGGYVANLGNEQAPALQLIDDLMQYNWIDRHSRALFVEFNVWNANTNLFNMVILCFELPSEGSFLTTVTIDTVQLYRFVDVIVERTHWSALVANSTGCSV